MREEDFVMAAATAPADGAPASGDKAAVDRSATVHPDVLKVLTAMLLLLGFTDAVCNERLANHTTGLDWTATARIMGMPGFFEGLKASWTPACVTRTQLIAAFTALEGVEWRVSEANPICTSDCSAAHRTVSPSWPPRTAVFVTSGRLSSSHRAPFC
jgi:hypothetical protein